MFGISELRRRVKSLEDRLARSERDAACAAGKHEWELCIHERGSKPHVRCMHCYFHPTTETKGDQS